ncbi:hypothetical protein J6590_099829 [Homalodisca vitripennis]|nr:hypothetical protein J6590_099829 [Homalodisca vitripennis]
MNNGRTLHLKDNCVVIDNAPYRNKPDDPVLTSNIKAEMCGITKTNNDATPYQQATDFDSSLRDSAAATLCPPHTPTSPLSHVSPRPLEMQVQVLACPGDGRLQAYVVHWTVKCSKSGYERYARLGVLEAVEKCRVSAGCEHTDKSSSFIR